MIRLQKNIVLEIFFITLVFFGKLPVTTAQDAKELKYKNISCALGTLHLIPPGFGYGIEVGMPVSERHNIAITASSGLFLIAELIKKMDMIEKFVEFSRWLKLLQQTLYA